jgi:hypothetical protein
MTTTFTSLRGIARALGTGRKAATTIIRAGKIRTRQYPGRPREYALEDAMRLAREAGGDEQPEGFGSPDDDRNS